MLEHLSFLSQGTIPRSLYTRADPSGLENDRCYMRSVGAAPNAIFVVSIEEENNISMLECFRPSVSFLVLLQQYIPTLQLREESELLNRLI